MDILIAARDTGAAQARAHALSACPRVPGSARCIGGTALDTALDATLDAYRACTRTGAPAPREIRAVLACDALIIEDHGARDSWSAALAPALRCMGGASLLIGVAPEPHPDLDIAGFNLRAGSDLDQVVRVEHLATGALWERAGAPAPDGFAPWHWPGIADSATRRRRATRRIGRSTREPVCALAGLRGSASRALGMRARGLLAPQQRWRDASLAQTHDLFTHGPGAMTQRERAALLAHAQAGREGAVRAFARTVAWQLQTWLDETVRIENDVVVDLPTLIERLPIVLGPGLSDLRAWNAATRASDPRAALAQAPHRDTLLASVIRTTPWADRILLAWPAIARLRGLDKALFETNTQEWPDAVFTHDTSEFRQSTRAATRIVTATDGQVWNRRWIAELPGRRYAPRARIAHRAPGHAGQQS